MGVSTIRRTALDGWLRAVRLPVDTGVKLLGRDQDWAVALGLAVDRADAGVRDLTGRIFRDERLQDDARARRAAAEERQRALELRLEAKRRKEQADGRFEDRLDQADERRTVAEQRADNRRQRLQEQQQREKQRLAEEERRRKQTTRQMAGAKAESIEHRSRGARLEQLKQEAEVLNQDQETLTAASEAQRLRRAAEDVKANRKGS